MRCALLSWNESLPLIQLLGWMKQISQNSRLIDGSDGSNAIMILGHRLGTRAAAPPGPPAFKLRPGASVTVPAAATVTVLAVVCRRPGDSETVTVSDGH
jgi:hypothetical protein